MQRQDSSFSDGAQTFEEFKMVGENWDNFNSIRFLTKTISSKISTLVTVNLPIGARQLPSQAATAADIQGGLRPMHL